jgi:hypothetical protein
VTVNTEQTLAQEAPNSVLTPPRRKDWHRALGARAGGPADPGRVAKDSQSERTEARRQCEQIPENFPHWGQKGHQAHRILHCMVKWGNE